MAFTKAARAAALPWSCRAKYRTEKDRPRGDELDLLFLRGRWVPEGLLEQKKIDKTLEQKLTKVMKNSEAANASAAFSDRPDGATVPDRCPDDSDFSLVPSRSFPSFPSVQNLFCSAGQGLRFIIGTELGSSDASGDAVINADLVFDDDLAPGVRGHQ